MKIHPKTASSCLAASLLALCTISIAEPGQAQSADQYLLNEAYAGQPPAPLVIPGQTLNFAGNGYTVGAPTTPFSLPQYGLSPWLHQLQPAFSPAWGHQWGGWGSNWSASINYAQPFMPQNYAWGLRQSNNYWQFANRGLPYGWSGHSLHSLGGPMSGYGFVQTAPSKAAGNYYAPASADSQSGQSGSYYAEKPAYQYMRPSKSSGNTNYYRPQKNYWGSSSPFPADLNSTPWSK